MLHIQRGDSYLVMLNITISMQSHIAFPEMSITSVKCNASDDKPNSVEGRLNIIVSVLAVSATKEIGWLVVLDLIAL